MQTGNTKALLAAMTQAAQDELDKIRADALAECARHPYTGSTHIRAGGGRSTRDSALAGIQRREDAASSVPLARLALAEKLAKYVDMIDGGAMTIVDALKLENGSDLIGAVTKAGATIAAPHNARVHRERCAEINRENDGREFAEQMLGEKPGSLGSATRPRSDSVDERHLRPGRG